jgi:hypothetical protein
MYHMILNHQVTNLLGFQIKFQSQTYLFMSLSLDLEEFFDAAFLKKIQSKKLSVLCMWAKSGSKFEYMAFNVNSVTPTLTGKTF